MEKVSNSVGEVCQYEKRVEKEEYDIKVKDISDFGHESFFFKLWLKITSFFKSIPIDVLYNQELIRRLSRELKHNAGQYINISKGIYTKNFYELLSALKKTQSFFSSLLDSYNSEKSNFYMTLSSFTSPYAYGELIKASENFENIPDISISAKNAVIRKIEKIISEMDEASKGDMYAAARAIEWIKIFCDAPLDKILSKFEKEESSFICKISSIQNDMELLASVLSSAKNIPVNTIQALFLLHNIDSSGNSESVKEHAEKNCSEFIDDAKRSLSAVINFKKHIPMVQLIRYVKQEIDWEPLVLSGGEDWAFYFRNAWKERLNEKWEEWVFIQKKAKTAVKMTEILDADILENLKYKPWVRFLGENAFKRELPCNFLKTMFKEVYPEKMLPDLKILLTEGNFYRQENVSEYSNSLAKLTSLNKEIEKFEENLSPAGSIGSAFASIPNTEVLTADNKKQLDILMQSTEAEAQKITTYALNTLKSLNTILLGIISGSKTGIYATLTNLSAIQGKDNKKFQKSIFEIKKLIGDIVDLIEEAENFNLNS